MSDELLLDQCENKYKKPILTEEMLSKPREKSVNLGKIQRENVASYMKTKFTKSIFGNDPTQMTDRNHLITKTSLCKNEVKQKLGELEKIHPIEVRKTNYHLTEVNICSINPKINSLLSVHPTLYKHEKVEVEPIVNEDLKIDEELYELEEIMQLCSVQ